MRLVSTRNRRQTPKPRRLKRLWRAGETLATGRDISGPHWNLKDWRAMGDESGHWSTVLDIAV